MEGYKLTLSTGTETSEEEISAIKEAFAEGFELSIDKSIIHLSEDQLPLLISFGIGVASGILSNTFYDLLKNAIAKLLNNHSPRIKRKIIVKIAHKKRNIVIAKEYIGVQSQSEELKYHSIEDLFEDLRKG